MNKLYDNLFDNDVELYYVEKGKENFICNIKNQIHKTEPVFQMMKRVADLNEDTNYYVLNSIKATDYNFQGIKYLNKESITLPGNLQTSDLIETVVNNDYLQIGGLFYQQQFIWTGVGLVFSRVVKKVTYEYLFASVIFPNTIELHPDVAMKIKWKLYYSQ